MITGSQRRADGGDAGDSAMNVMRGRSRMTSFVDGYRRRLDAPLRRPAGEPHDRAVRRAAAQTFADTPVAFAYLFGSHAHGDATPSSDIDVAVALPRVATIDERLELALTLARRMESVLGVGPVEALVVLDDAPIALAGRVVRDGVLIYSADDAARVDHFSRTLREFFDFDLHDRALAQEQLRATAEGRR